MRALLATLLVLTFPLSAQGIFNNAAKPGDTLCAQSAVESNSQAPLGNFEKVYPNMWEHNFNLARPTDTGHPGDIKTLAAGIQKDSYREGHAFFPLSERKDVPHFTAYDKDGKPISIAGLKGKIVVVGFWSYHCEPSARMVMDMAQLYPRREKFGFEILAVNFDRELLSGDNKILGGWPAIKTFETHNAEFFGQYPIPFYVPGIGKEGGSNFLDVVDSLPLLAVIDRDGKLASLDIGYQPKIVSMRLSQLIKEEQAAKAAGK